MIRTTINIGKEELQILTQAAKSHGLKIETLILRLLRHSAKKLKKELVINRSVQYQNSRIHGNWECVHVSLAGSEYEFLIDMRKIHKKSVSRLIAEAINMYLMNESLNLRNILDNNQYHNYNISKNNMQNIIECSFMWIFPPGSIKK